MYFFSQKSYKGFTLIEVMVALFVFLIIMASMSQSFTQSFASYKNTKTVQRDVENAQFALNLLAKELRTSSIVSIASASSKSVKFFDYSQGVCFEYIIDPFDDLLKVKKTITTPRTLTECASTSFGSITAFPITTGHVTGKFVIDPSTTGAVKHVGKVTVILEISEGASATHIARLQTTASLRDYGYVGL